MRWKRQLTSVLLRLFASFLFLFRINFFQILRLDGLGKISAPRQSGFWSFQNISNYKIWRIILIF